MKYEYVTFKNSVPGTIEFENHLSAQDWFVAHCGEIQRLQAHDPTVNVYKTFPYNARELRALDPPGHVLSYDPLTMRVRGLIFSSKRTREEPLFRGRRNR